MRHSLFLLCTLLLLGSCKPDGPKHFNPDLLLQNWQLQQSSLINAEGKELEKVEHLMKPEWKQGLHSTLSIQFKEEGKLDYSISSEDSLQNQAYKGFWRWEQNQHALRYHARKALFDTNANSLLWQVKALDEAKLILARGQMNGDSLYQEFRAIP